MKWLIPIWFILSVGLAQAQPNWAWARSHTSISQEIAADVAIIPSGGTNYTAGIFKGDLSTVFPAGVNGTPNMTSPLGLTDGYVVKHDADGNYEWAFRIGGPGAEVEIRAIDARAAGDFFIVGAFHGTVNFQGVNTSISTTLSSTGGARDMFVAMYNPNGELNWVVRSSCNADVSAADVDVNNTGVYVTGFYGEADMTILGTSSTSAFLVNGANNNDVFVLGLTQTGMVKWATRAGDLDDRADEGLSVSARLSSIFVGGTIQGNTVFYNPVGSNLSLSPFTVNRKTIFLASYRAVNGQLNWVNRIGSNRDSELGGIVAKGARLYAAGTINDDMGAVNFPGISPITFPGNQDELFLCQIDTFTLNTNWVEVMPNSNGSKPRMTDVERASVNEIVISGVTAGTHTFGGATAFGSGGSNGFVANFLTDGTFNWVTGITGAGTGEVNGIDLGGSDYIYAAGSYQTDADFGVYTMPTESSFNGWTGKLGGCNSPPIAGTAAFTGAAGCGGNPIAVHIMGAGGGTLQWQVSYNGGMSWSNVAGANAGSANITATSPNVSIRCVTSSAGCGDNFSNVISTTLDETPPTFTCIPDQNVIAAPTCMYTLPDYSLDPTLLASIGDNCGAGNVSISQVPLAGTSVGLGNTDVKLYFQDVVGNIDSCEFQLNIIASVNPTPVNCGNHCHAI